MECSNMIFEGFLDSCNDETIDGWAWNRKQPDNPIMLLVFDGDSQIETISAGRFRLDLFIAKKGNGEHGFKYVIPKKLKDGKKHKISIKFTDGNNINNSPIKLYLIENILEPVKIINIEARIDSKSLTNDYNKDILQKLVQKEIFDLGNVVAPKFSGIYSTITEQNIVDQYLHEGFTDNALGYDKIHTNYDALSRMIQTAFGKLKNPPFCKEQNFFNKKERILDIGSGSGNSIIPLLQLFPDSTIIGTDLSPEMLYLLRKKIPIDGSHDNLILLQLNAEDLCFSEESFDIIIGSSILHHLYSPDKTIKGCFRILKKGGVLIFFEPFENAYMILRCIFEDILNDPRKHTLSSELIYFLQSQIFDISIRKGRDKSPSCFRHLEDKWLFTKIYFEQMTEEFNFSNCKIYPIYNNFENKVKDYLGVLQIAEEKSLPEWAWEKIRRFDSNFSEDFKHDMPFEGCIIMEK